MQKPVRLQSAFISETEVKKVVDYIAQHNEAEIPVDIGGTTGAEAGGGASAGGGFDDGEEDDDMYEAARQAVIESGKASTSFLQRRLGLGYSRAARIMDQLEQRGVIGPANGAKPRDILEKGGGSPALPAASGEEEVL
ncbi:MAG TPA: DNA translocase FtsK, partial [Candidatus Paceibacterota bacterium]|nr:DNA translocase FtsK [Candidatus Paceibacterota bacterium]